MTKYLVRVGVGHIKTPQLQAAYVQRIKGFFDKDNFFETYDKVAYVPDEDLKAAVEIQYIKVDAA